MRLVLYSTGCPKCTVLKKKLESKNIEFEENNSVDEMMTLGISTVPILKLDSTMMDFATAVKWVNEQ